MENLNPKHNPLAKRKNKGKWIGGVYIPADLLKKAQEERIMIMAREMIRKRIGWRKRLWYWFKRLWLKILFPLHKVKVSDEEKAKAISDFKRTEHYDGEK